MHIQAHTIFGLASTLLSTSLNIQSYTPPSRLIFFQTILFIPAMSLCAYSELDQRLATQHGGMVKHVPCKSLHSLPLRVPPASGPLLSFGSLLLLVTLVVLVVLFFRVTNVKSLLYRV